jgi:hypothetical protein
MKRLKVTKEKLYYGERLRGIVSRIKEVVTGQLKSIKKQKNDIEN